MKDTHAHQLTPEQRKTVAAYVWSVRKALLSLGRYRAHIHELRGVARRAVFLSDSLDSLRWRSAR